MAKEETDQINVGDFTFGLTGGNDMKLRALIRYAQFLDYRVDANPNDGNELSIDGLVNYLLSQAMDKMIKDLVKKHSFENENDFYDTVAECKDGEELKVEIVKKERNYAEKLHDEILSYVPMDEKQLKLDI